MVTHRRKLIAMGEKNFNVKLTDGASRVTELEKI
jgi:hypothetical protein